MFSANVTLKSGTEFTGVKGSVYMSWLFDHASKAKVVPSPAGVTRRLDVTRNLKLTQSNRTLSLRKQYQVHTDDPVGPTSLVLPNSAQKVKQPDQHEASESSAVGNIKSSAELEATFDETQLLELDKTPRHRYLWGCSSVMMVHYIGYRIIINLVQLDVVLQLNLAHIWFMNVFAVGYRVDQLRARAMRIPNFIRPLGSVCRVFDLSMTQFSIRRDPSPQNAYAVETSTDFRPQDQGLCMHTLQISY